MKLPFFKIGKELHERLNKAKEEPETSGPDEPSTPPDEPGPLPTF